MERFGIYTLANDNVYDQLVALLNSIESNVSSDIPICIIPFDDRTARIQQAIDSRPNITLFEDRAALEHWDSFLKVIWSVHPQAKQKFSGKPDWSPGHNRKYAAFNGKFDRFVFYDADSLAMKPLDKVIDKLNDYDFVFDDWEHTKPKEKTALDIDRIEKNNEFKESDIRPKLHCSSFFGSKRGIFDQTELSFLQQKLIENQEITWIPRWWDDAFLFNYMTLRCDRQLFNFTLSPNEEDRTGNCANADPFIAVDWVLYNKEKLKPIHRIHYMGYSSTDFQRLCEGEDVDIPFKEVFLYYRFLRQPDQKPTVLKPPNFKAKTSRLIYKLTRKFFETSKLV